MMTQKSSLSPLAERCRPVTPEDFIGQEHLMGEGRIIRQIIDEGNAFSLVLWGEPGSGKTTLATIIAERCHMEAHFLSAISAGVADVRKVIEKGKQNRAEGHQTLLFLDEIHRFNKAQQDAVLGAVESGDIILIGATTENPSFSVISPLLSRSRVIRLNPLTSEDLDAILERALLKDELFKNKKVSFGEGVRERLLKLGGGDARRLLNILETSWSLSDKENITEENLAEAVKHAVIYYDKAGDKHYDTISAFIKSLRGSDPNAAVYYLARMILAGEDPLFLARRLVIFASEDIGNAAPTALNVAVSAYTAVKNIGMPEAEIILSQCATFLASAPKSNASYRAIKDAKQIAKGEHQIPLHIRNAPTGLMKEMGYGKDYKYPHDFPGHFVDELYLPDEVKDQVFYRPTGQGGEKAILERLKSLWPKKYGK